MPINKNNPSPKIKHLKLNPLSVAKFFYKEIGERALDPAFIQPIIYLCHKELKKKENLLLFEEEFKISEYTPFLPSLDKLLENENKIIKELTKAEDINNFLVIKYLKSFAQKYNDTFACELQFKASRSSNSDRRMNLR